MVPRAALLFVSLALSPSGALPATAGTGASPASTSASVTQLPSDAKPGSTNALSSVGSAGVAATATAGAAAHAQGVSADNGAAAVAAREVAAVAAAAAASALSPASAAVAAAQASANAAAPPAGAAVAASSAAAVAYAAQAATAARAASDAAAVAVQQAGLAKAAATGPASAPENSSVAPAAAAGEAGALGTTTVTTQESTLSSYVPSVSTLLAGLTFAALVKGMCMASNIMVQVSPYPQVTRWELRSCTGEADPAPYVSIAFGGWQWCYYGMFAYLWTGRSGFLILVQSNFLGALLGSYYVFTFYRNCQHESSRSNLYRYLNGVLAVVMVQVCALVTLPSERALFLTGLISSFCSFLGALSMLVSVPTVLQTKNSKTIPGPIVVANCFSAFVWCLCGWMLSDPLVMGPNIVSVLASSTCIYLKFLYPSDDEKSADSEELGECALASAGGSEPLKRKLDKRAPTERTPLTEGLKTKAAKAVSTFGPPKVEEGERDAGQAPCVPKEELGGTGGTF